ncbi:MAG: EpsG family protein [Bacteroidaceae bacterium]|nr:EpsG family protein [Bacteroidaceae bacterium]
MQYYFIVVIIIILAAFFTANGKKTSSDRVLLFSVFLLFLFSAFRIGFTPDYYNYENHFDNPESVLLNERHDNEWLYRIIVTIFSYRWALVLQSTLLCICLFFALKIFVNQRFRPYCYIIFFFYSSFFLGLLSGFRSSFVTIGLFLAIMAKNEFKIGWIYGLAFMIAAAGIHQSGLFLLPLLFIPQKPLSKTVSSVLLIFSIALILVSLFGANLINMLVLSNIQYMEEYEVYMQDEISNIVSIGYFTILRLLLLSYLFFYSFSFCKKEIPGNESIFVKLTALFFLINFLPGVGLINRFYCYFAFVSLPGFATMVKYETDKRKRMLFIAAFIFFSLWRFYLFCISPIYTTYYAHYGNILIGL